MNAWTECVAIHLNAGTGFYGVERFRAGDDTLGPIESAEIGGDTLCLARRGATVTGPDYAPSAIAAARALAAEAGLPATFVERDLHDAPAGRRTERPARRVIDRTR
jgi:hypothetical protein